jgi:hypothetical protein
MRFKKSLLLAGTVAFIAVIFLALGCSDDDTQPTPPVPENNGIESLLSDVQTQVHLCLDSTVNAMYAGLKVAAFIETGSNTDIGDIFMGSGIPDSILNIQPWVVAYLTDLQSGTGLKTIIDSLTYIVNGHLSVNAHDAQGMYARHKYNYVSEDTTVTFSDLSNNDDLQILGINTTTATLNGTFSSVRRDKVVTEDSTVWNNWTVDVTMTDLTFAKDGSVWTSGCPNSGSCTVTALWQYTTEDEIPVTTEWQFDITFTDGVMDVDVSIGNLSASYEYTLCTL